MKRSLFFILLSFVALFFIGCPSNEIAPSDKVDQSEIYQFYSVEYDASEKVLTAFAQFRFGGANGTTLSLTAPSEVDFNDIKMPLEQGLLRGAFYELQIREQFPETFLFRFTDSDEKVFENTGIIIPVLPGEQPEAINTAYGISIEWQGAPVGDNEEISVNLMDHTGTSVKKTVSVKGATAIELAAGDMKSLVSGHGEMFFQRALSLHLEEATPLGGQLSVLYKSASVGIELLGRSSSEEVVDDNGS
ncbi:MAG: hypothetical protein RQ866_04580 [Bacteroidales bacterium]|nr:hypothetical protein [Bacteroidales bacterium]